VKFLNINNILLRVEETKPKVITNISLNIKVWETANTIIDIDLKNKEMSSINKK